MGLRINTNVPSLLAQYQVGKTFDGLKETSKHLSTGYRVINGKDDAAGLAISEKIRTGMRATAQNLKNAQNGFFLLQTADGALGEVTNLLVRMKELAVQASTGSVGDRERSYMGNEYSFLKEEINRIAQSTVFNGQPLLNGLGEEIRVQVGPNNRGVLDRIKVTQAYDVTPDALRIAQLTFDEREDARASLDPLDEAISEIGRIRGSIGAGESRLSSTMNALMHYKENITGAYSQIRDADLAVETSNYAKLNVLSQAGVAILAQANSAPEAALRLLN